MSAKLPEVGDVIDGTYELLHLIGRGGMGAVYKARHMMLESEVAVKVMLADPGNEEAARRFVNEGKAAARIRSEHVVAVTHVAIMHGFGYAYMVLELLEGRDLAQVLEVEKRLAPHVAVAYVVEALEGVRQAHAQEIVHRDLKPSNLFLAKQRDGSTIVKVLDFGISKSQAANALGQTPGSLTSTKAMLGSPLYMSPEQLRSSKSVDARADIWAMGIILYELVTGTLPFGGENLGELFAAILENDAPPVRSRAPDVPPGLEAIIMHCLQRKPEHRYQTVADLERALVPFATSATGTQAAHAGAMGGVPGTMMLGAGQARAYQPGMQSSPSYVGGAPSMQGAPSMLGPGARESSAGTNPGLPHIGATTGSGVNIPLVRGTAPLGAITPQPHGTSGWQPPPPMGSKVGVILAACAVLVLVGVGLAGFAFRGKLGKGGAGAGDPSASETTTAEVPSATSSEAQTVASTVPSSSTPASTETTVPSASPPATLAGHATTPPATAHHNATKPPPPKPSETKPPEAPPKPPEHTAKPPVKPPPTPSATGVQQNSR